VPQRPQHPGDPQSSEVTIQCHDCNKSFKRRDSYIRHRRLHNPKSRNFPCRFPGCDCVGPRAFY
jgi:hypothetical protein